MATRAEKLVFGFLGAVAAIVVGLSLFGNFEKSGRVPASESLPPEQPDYRID